MHGYGARRVYRHSTARSQVVDEEGSQIWTLRENTTNTQIRGGPAALVCVGPTTTHRRTI